MKRAIKLNSITFALIVLSLNVNAQNESIAIKRIDTPVIFDGVVDDNEWSSFTPVNLIVHRPNYGNEPSENSEVYIGYDNTYFWFGARLFMKDVSKIFCTSKRRDEMLYGMDSFGVLLDTYNDNENAMTFLTTPTGLRTDYTISNDASGGVTGGGGAAGGFGQTMNYSWNAFWDVKTSQDNKGWQVEMRIPFSSLRFKTDDHLVIMGLTILRTIGYANEIDTYPAIDPKFGPLAVNKPSQAKKIVLDGIKPTQPVYISPFIISGFTKEYSLNEQENGYINSDKTSLNAGIDLKYSIKSNFTIDLTANTDFAQVEADDQQVNLTRYSLFFPEKRMFFQERSSLFNFSLGGRADNLFYSRNIGIFNGELIKIYGGARMMGNIGKWELGFLDMQTEKSEDIPSENFGVLRVRRQVFNPNSYLGSILTTRIGVNGDKNIAFGFDGIFKVIGNDYLNIKWAQMWDSNTGNNLNSLNSSAIYADWERRSEKGFAYRINYRYLGTDFNPGTGFIMRNGVQGINGNLLYGRFPGEKSKIFNYALNLRGEYLTRIEDGKLENSNFEPGFRINTKSGYRFDISLEFRKEGVESNFDIEDSIRILQGNYSYYNLQFRFGTPSSRMVSLMGSVDAGQFYDGHKFTLRPSFNLNFSPSFRIRTEYQFNALRFPDRSEPEKLNIHLVNSNLMYMFSTKLSATLMVQYVNTSDDFIANFRLRYNPREGNDLYLVINDYQGFDRLSVIPHKPPFFNRTIVVKYTHTFIL